ncbi:serine--tRNA mitochondrial [Labeo rohita]|uniref:serine--tRNA ligase n=1 Tax=Labeo rohita TaxID=84645 RepID=A0A498M5J5_LABRO|nr:serine--tRNA mitochondrial [Labeo rohita]
MQRVCEETDTVKAEVENRKGDLRAADVEFIISVWKKLQKVQKEISDLETRKNVISAKVRALVDEHEKSTLASLEEYTSAREEGRAIREKLSQLYVHEGELEKEHYCRALRLPNRTHPSVPIGDESQARVVELVGEKQEFNFKPKGHLQIGESLDIIRQRRLAHVSGHRSYYLRGAGARLQFALQNYTMDLLQKREGCGMQPNAHKSQVYSLDPSRFPDLNLAGTGEVGVAGQSVVARAIEQKQILAERPGVSTEFTILTRVLDMPTQELGPPAFRKYDIEAWMPGRGSYGEISSASNCTDYQSRRLNILYEGNDGNLKYAHTVNATACAVPRTVIAILETHQTKEGTVLVPEVLQHYLGLKVIEKPEYTPIKYIGPNQPKRHSSK